MSWGLLQSVHPPSVVGDEKTTNGLLSNIRCLEYVSRHFILMFDPSYPMDQMESAPFYSFNKWHLLDSCVSFM